MRVIVALLIASFVGYLPAQTFQQSYAIVVGIRSYAYNKDLPNAQSDAEAIAAILKSQDYKVTELYNQQATRGAILDAMDRIAQVVDEHDRVLFFFAGHGYTNTIGNEDWGYIVPYDGKQAELSSLIGMDQLRTESQRLGGARHELFLLDSCYGGTIGRDIPGGGVDIHVPDYINQITRRDAREALTAGGKDQQVEDGAKNGHSRFTNALTEAIGEGKADTNQDGYVTFPELSSYVMSRGSSSMQTPAEAWLPGHGEGEYWFTSPIAATTSVGPDPQPVGSRRGDGGASARSTIEVKPTVTTWDARPADGVAVTSPPKFQLHGIPGFNPFPMSTHGLSATPVFTIGSNLLEAEWREQQIHIFYSGQQVGTLSCENISVRSSRAKALDLTYALIMNVDHVTLSSSNGSFDYYSSNLSSDMKNQIRVDLNALCHHY